MVSVWLDFAEVEPTTESPKLAEGPRSPSFELWIAFAVSVVPHAVGLFVGGYGQILTNAPLAVIVTIVDLAAVVIATLQFREDSRASRSSHWVVWATIALGAIWLLYAVFVGLVIILGQVFCINKLCRAPLR